MDGASTTVGIMKMLGWCAKVGWYGVCTVSSVLLVVCCQHECTTPCVVDASCLLLVVLYVVIFAHSTCVLRVQRCAVFTVCMYCVGVRCHVYICVPF